MRQAQLNATAAASRELGRDVRAKIIVQQLIPDFPAADQLREGDQIVAINGAELRSAEQLVAATTAGQGAVAQLQVRASDGQTRTVTLQPKKTEHGYFYGIQLQTEYENLPRVDYSIENIGGPSAGMMFALSIIEKSLDEDLTGGRKISGTGTINGASEVGPIGGLKQKIHAAHQAGSELMLMPVENCEDIPERVPAGVFLQPVENLGEAVQAVRDFRDGKKLVGTARCKTAK
nr:S16 family serine protease [Canibacter zhuwentaonis]